VIGVGAGDEAAIAISSASTAPVTHLTATRCRKLSWTYAEQLEWHDRMVVLADDPDSSGGA
jgi:hypothetical protein